MLGRLVGFSLRNRLLVLTLAAILFGGGLYTAARSPMDAFPEFAPPQVKVETEAPGLSAEEVEALVTLRLETAINGTPGITLLRSTSMPGVSGITAIFRDGTDVYRDRQLVAERVSTVIPDLPASVKAPELVPLTSASSTLEVVGITSDGPSDPIAARAFADWTVKPRLLAVPGVSKVVTYGGRVGQYQVLVDPNALRDHDLALSDILRAARDATAIGPAGTVETHGQRFAVRSLAQPAGVADLKSAVVAFRDATPITLGRVAQVRLGPAFPIGDATLNGAPAVVLLVARQPGVNTVSVTADLDRALSEISRHLPPGLALHPGLFRQASFIEQGVRNVRQALWIGGLLVVIVLVLFLLDWRTATISVAAIPLSLLAAIIVLRALGATINMMTLGGLAIALGEVVDDSIIDVENIHRRLRENRRRQRPRGGNEVIFDASLEVRSSVVYATFLVALVFLPVFFLSGVAGRIFAPLGYAYVLATLASLAVALLVTPAASSLLLTRGRERGGEGRFVAFLKRRYESVLRRFLHRPMPCAAGAAAVLLLAAAGIPFLKGEFIPAFQEESFIVHMAGLPGTALGETAAAGKEVERRLLSIPGVVSAAQRAGRAELADEIAGAESSEFDVRLSSGIADVGGKVREIREKLAGIPGFAFAVSQFLKERIEEVGGGETAPVAVSLFGPSLEELQRKGTEVAQLMNSIPGARDVQVAAEARVPQIVVRFDHQKAAQLGVSLADLQRDVSAAFEGTEVNEIFEGQKVVPLVVKYPDRSRGDLDAIRGLPVRTGAGIVPLAAVADVSVRDAPRLISREGGSRRLAVTCGVAGNVGSFTARLEKALRGLPLPPGYSLKLSGDYASQRRSLRELLLLGLVALLGIFLLLATDFRSAPLALLVLVNLPLALVGGIGAALLLHITLSLGALVGFVTLFGITARNSIMLLSHYRHLEEREAVEFGPELIVRGSLDRLPPILMTALVTGLALLPLVVGGSRAGQEIEHPMAVIIVGGLASSTVLNLLLMPAFYLFVRSRRRPGAASQSAG